MSEIFPVQKAEPSEKEKAKLYDLLAPLLKTKQNSKRLARKVAMDAGDSIYETRPYYNEKMALKIKPIVDEIIADGVERCFPYIEFPRLTKHSVYLMIVQACRYLVDHTEDYKKYDGLFKFRKATAGVSMSYISDIEDKPFKAIITTDFDMQRGGENDLDRIRPNILDFINKNDKGKIEFAGLKLNDEEQAMVTTILNDAQKVDEKLMYRVNRDSVTIVRLEKRQ